MKPEEIAKGYKLMEDGLSLAQIGKELGIAKMTVYDNLSKDAVRYARAREFQAQHWFEEYITVTKELLAGVEKDHVQSKKTASDNLKWIIAKMYPKMYGERQTIEHEGAVSVRHEGLSRFDELVAQYDKGSKSRDNKGSDKE